MRNLAATGSSFDEAAYLDANPDVRAAVAGGVFATGLDHYLAFGRRENRPGVPPPPPGVPVDADAGAAPPEALRYRVHGGRDLGGFETVGKIVAANVHAAVAPVLDFRDDTSILDFGCGCGRVLTHIHELCGRGRFFGTYIDAEAIAWCEANLSALARFATNPIWPPLPFADKFFDFVFSVSIFTHLPEDMQLAWLSELRRVVKPGGWLVLTTHGEALFPAGMPDAFAQFQRQGFLYAVVGATEGLPDFYQAAFHTEAYIRAQWGRCFEIVRIARKGIANNQDLILCRRPG